MDEGILYKAGDLAMINMFVDDQRQAKHLRKMIDAAKKADIVVVLRIPDRLN